MADRSFTNRLVPSAVVALLTLQAALITWVQIFTDWAELLLERLESIGELPSCEVDIVLPDVFRAVPMTIDSKHLLMISTGACAQHFINEDAIDGYGLCNARRHAATNNLEQTMVPLDRKSAPSEDVVQAINLRKEFGIREYKTNITAGEG